LSNIGFTLCRNRASSGGRFACASATIAAKKSRRLRLDERPIALSASITTSRSSFGGRGWHARCSTPCHECSGTSGSTRVADSRYAEVGVQWRYRMQGPRRSLGRNAALSVALERTMPLKSPSKSLGDKLADLLDRLVGGLAQPLRPAPAPVPVPVRRPDASRGARIRR
jgi:hypothetical protein